MRNAAVELSAKLVGVKRRPDETAGRCPYGVFLSPAEAGGNVVRVFHFIE